VTVNYRLDRRTKKEGGDLSLKYPVPVHDTLAGFDWILKHLKPSQLCVFGSHIGGSLAVMLALTEPRSIRAVAALDPICDWVGLNDYCQIAADADMAEDGEPSGLGVPSRHVDEAEQPRKRGRRKKHAPPDLVPLLEARNRLFHKPAGYFDSFASPALFLRSSGKACPKAFPTYLSGPEYPVPILQRPVNLDQEDDEWYSDFLGTDSDIDFLPEAVEPTSASGARKDVRRRKALIRWPPHGLDYSLDHFGSRSGEELPDQLVLPDVRIFVHSNLANDDATALERIPESDDASESEQAASLQEVESDQSQTSTDGEATKLRHSSRGPITDIRKSTTGETVLARQGAEMVSLMHHACFWGHPAGFGGDRVKIVRVPFLKEPSLGETIATQVESRDSVDLDVEIDAAKWFADILQIKQKEQVK
jgi:pimeloyl-ACP methyl ester carboxylesterase